MRKVVSYSNKFVSSPEDKLVVIVKSADEIIRLRDEVANENIKIRLVINSIDEELTYLLINFNIDFEIILQSNNIKEGDMILLNKYKTEKNNKVYLAYNIDDSSPFERATLVYYINRYEIICLLSTKNEELYREWTNEMTKYTEKKNVKRLNKTYIGKHC